jgi:hypothetical protein
MRDWPEPSAEIVAGSEWITLQHRSGDSSRVGQPPPVVSRDPTLNFLARLQQNKIVVSHGAGVSISYEFGNGLWTESRFQNDRLRQGPEPLTFSDVLDCLRSESDRQRACDIDPRSAAALPQEAVPADAT